MNENGDLPAPAARVSFWRVLRNAIAVAIAGAIVVPVLVFAGGAILNAFNPACGTPGDSGGCEMGVAVLAIYSVLPGAAFGFAAVFIGGLWR